MKLDPFARFCPWERTLALSDGVFAVVITLLVLGIEVPERGMLGNEGLAKLGHQIFIYFVFLCLVAMYWS
jgi:uncharacterized membrane protein